MAGWIGSSKVTMSEQIGETGGLQMLRCGVQMRAMMRDAGAGGCVGRASVQGLLQASSRTRTGDAVWRHGRQELPELNRASTSGETRLGS